ncbi:hypothetical protein ACFE04_023869 [Oxalis oulophora]
MVGKRKNKKKHQPKNTQLMSEKNLSPILQKYSTLIVLRMLGHIVDNLGENLDWNELVRNTSTEITNPRKYQMLWRHLAYVDLLVDVGNVEQQLVDFLSFLTRCLISIACYYIIMYVVLM